MSNKSKSRIIDLEKQVRQLTERVKELEDHIYVDAVGTKKVPIVPNTNPYPTSPPYPKEFERKDGIRWEISTPNVD